MKGRALARQAASEFVGDTVYNLDFIVVITLAAFGVYPRAVRIRVKSNPINWLANGTAPTASSGIYAADGETIELDTPGKIGNFQAIATSAGYSNIDISVYV